MGPGRSEEGSFCGIEPRLQVDGVEQHCDWALVALRLLWATNNGTPLGNGLSRRHQQAVANYSLVISIDG